MAKDRRLANRASLREHDNKVARKHAGRILSKNGVLKLFGYSTTTYIHDTTINSNGLIKQVGRDKYEVVSPK